MDIRAITGLEVLVGFTVTVLVTFFYGVFAPWYKQSAGRYIFGLLLSLTLLTGFFAGITFYREIFRGPVVGLIVYATYIVAITFMGVGIFKAQIGQYRKRKFIRAEIQRHRQL